MSAVAVLAAGSIALKRRGVRMVGHIHMHDAPSVVGEDDENEQDPERRGGDGEEVQRRALGQMRPKERA